MTANDDGGHPVERIQYYHRGGGCQIVSSSVKPLLAVEWLQPGEGEDTAALRLLSQLPELYGSRFFDILLLDSLNVQAPVLKLAAQIGWDLVITLKQENRDLYQSALRSGPTHHGNHFPPVGLDHHVADPRLLRQDRLATGARALEERKQRME